MNILNAMNAVKEADKDFFEIDQDESVACIQLEYENPDMIFDENIRTKIPKISEDFFDKVFGLVDLIPSKYGLDIHIQFDKMQGYGGDELREIFLKNVFLKIGEGQRIANRENRLALSLCVAGLCFILISTCLNMVWTDGGTAKTIIDYILDILATVPFWGATEILVINNREKLNYERTLKKRIRSVVFQEKEAGC